MAKIEKVFVLILENRSFDHMLGLLPRPGMDGLLDSSGNIKPGCSNVNGISAKKVSASSGAPDPIASDPPHEFCDVVMQLCGQRVIPASGGYPPISNSGFIDSYSGQFKYPLAYNCRVHRNPSVADPDDIMKCFEPSRVPALAKLAEQYSVCDHWFSSMPGPTWPNRFFVHAASSAGLDDSPTFLEMLNDYAVGQSFDNGTVFDQLNKTGVSWEIFCGDYLPQSFALHGMTREWLLNRRFTLFDKFERKIRNPRYAPQYVFIEPSWGALWGHHAFSGGTSQHPVDGIAGGERLIRDVYQAIRNSPHWEQSLLIITYDEHGGFYDHVQPGDAEPPGDRPQPKGNVKHGFDFTVLGARVPAVVVSPWIAPGRVDDTPYDHSSIIATLAKVFNFYPLTNRDAKANDLLHLLDLGQPRIADRDAPLDIPYAPPTKRALGKEVLDLARMPIRPITRGFLHVAHLKRQAILGHRIDRDGFVNLLDEFDLQSPGEIGPASSRDFRGTYANIAREFRAVENEAQALDYIREVTNLSRDHQLQFPNYY